MNSIPIKTSQNRASVFLPALFGLALVLFSVGCATSTQTRSGFISNYGNLKAVTDVPGLFAESKSTGRQNRPIRVAPVRWGMSDHESGAVNEHERLELCTYAQRELERAVEKASSKLTAPATDQPPLELRAAITRVETSNTALNIVTTIVVLMPLNNGGVCLEWKLIDPSSEKILAQGVAVQTGKPWQIKASFEALGHAKKGLTVISNQLSSYLAGTPNSYSPAKLN
jgi:hypothetical protein